MKRETLAELGLSKEQMDVVFAEHGKSITDIRTRLEAAEKERDELKQSFGSQKEEFESQFTEKQKEFAIGYMLKNADLHDRDLVLGLLDKEKISIADGEVTGLNEQLESIKESKPFLFKEADQTGSPTITVSGNPKAAPTPEKNAFTDITDKYN